MLPALGSSIRLSVCISAVSASGVQPLQAVVDHGHGRDLQPCGMSSFEMMNKDPLRGCSLSKVNQCCMRMI